MKTAPVANKSETPAQARGVVAETLLQAWMALSMLSLFPLIYFSGAFMYFMLTSGVMENPNFAQALPAEQTQNMAVSMALLANYMLFKALCTVVIHPRLGVGAVLRSDAKKLQAAEEK